MLRKFAYTCMCTPTSMHYMHLHILVHKQTYSHANTRRHASPYKHAHHSHAHMHRKVVSGLLGAVTSQRCESSELGLNFTSHVSALVNRTFVLLGRGSCPCTGGPGWCRPTGWPVSQPAMSQAVATHPKVAMVQTEGLSHKVLAHVWGMLVMLSRRIMKEG